MLPSSMREGVVTDVHFVDSIYQVAFFKCNGKDFFLFDYAETFEINNEYVLKSFFHMK